MNTAELMSLLFEVVYSADAVDDVILEELVTKLAIELYRRGYTKESLEYLVREDFGPKTPLHMGSNYNTWLNQEGISTEVDETAVRRVLNFLSRKGK